MKSAITIKQYLFISPHLDDAVLSCGAYIYKLIKNNNKAVILTVFSGSIDPRYLSPMAINFNNRCKLGKDAMLIRRLEDKKAAKFLCADTIHLDLHECLYRQNSDGTPRYLSDGDLFSTNLNKERDTINKVKKVLSENINFEKYDEAYIPLGIGRHIDHLIVREAIETLCTQNCNIKKIIYYEDIPYVCDDRDPEWRLDLTKGLDTCFYEISKNEYKAYLKVISLYKSQRHVLWYTKKIKMTQLLNYFKRYENSQFTGVLWTPR